MLGKRPDADHAVAALPAGATDAAGDGEHGTLQVRKYQQLQQNNGGGCPGTRTSANKVVKFLRKWLPFLEDPAANPRAGHVMALTIIAVYSAIHVASIVSSNEGLRRVGTVLFGAVAATWIAAAMRHDFLCENNRICKCLNKADHATRSVWSAALVVMLSTMRSEIKTR